MLPYSVTPKDFRGFRPQPFKLTLMQSLALRRAACKSTAERANSEMADSVPSAFSRRRFLRAVAVAVAPVAFVGRVRATLGKESEGVELEPTPAAGGQLDLTPKETAGPFFEPNSPLKNNFREAGVNGVPIDVTGFVLDRRGKPLPGVLLDFWHADGDGDYDMHGFRCRGHQFSDSNGRYTLETVVPGLYPGRTRHYHVRLQATRGPVLTTQLYFPGEERNASDSLFRSDLLVKMREVKGGRIATFNFVLAR
jgi:protocatechuate 3,4-dioxygenase beta subunit